MTRGYACGPVGLYGTTNESVQIPLSDGLVGDIVDEANSEQLPVEGQNAIGEPYIEYPDNVYSLVLLGADGSSLVMVGTPDGYTWYGPEHTEWEPSWELADRIWAEMGQDSNCTVPEYLYPPDVTVEVYDAGAGEVSVDRVSQHLEEAGFAVTNTGQTVPASPGGSIIMRGSNENGAGLWLVSSHFDTSGVGEMSREDDVVELLITAEFNDEAAPFVTATGLRAIDGSMTCTLPSESATPSTSAAPIPGLSPVGPSTGQEPAGDNLCERDAEARMTPTDLPGNTLPEGPVAVWLCDGTGSPVEPLVGKEAVQGVLDTFRALPASGNGAAELPVPNYAYVLVDYPDEQRYVIEVDTNATHEVRWGPDRQHVRYGGGEWLTELLELWKEQRDGVPLDPPREPIGDVCKDVNSKVQRTIDQYDEGATMCLVFEPGSGEPQTHSLQMHDELARGIGKEARSESATWPDGKMLDWTGAVLVLIDDYGDTLRLVQTAADTWMWMDPTGTWEWTPSPALQYQLPTGVEYPMPETVPTPS